MAGAWIRRLAAPLVLALGLLTIAAPFGARANGQDREPLTPAAISAFEQKLASARAAHADIAGRISCFEAQDRQLVAKRDADQLRLGQLVARKKTLDPLLIKQRELYESQKRTLGEERAELALQQQRLADLWRRKTAQEGALRNCKASRWTINAICDLAYGLAHLTGRFTDTQKDIADTQGRVDRAATATAEAERVYRESMDALSATTRDAETTAADIKTTEGSISRLWATLAALRPSVHDAKGLLDAFDTALDEARRVDTADGRARTARDARSLAIRVDEATQRSGALFSQARTTLTEPSLQACFQPSPSKP